MRGWLSKLKNSTRNWALNRSRYVKVLNTEKSTFLKPESRNIFRPVLPKLPAEGGVITELPFTKQPACASVPPASLSAATAVHFPHMALASVPEKSVGIPDTPL